MGYFIAYSDGGQGWSKRDDEALAYFEKFRADERAKIRAWAERNNKEVGVLESEDSGDWLHATVVDYYGLLAFLDNLGLGGE